RARAAPNLTQRARYAILLLDLGDLSAAQSLLAFSAGPNARSTLIEEFRSWHGDLAALPGLLRTCADGDCRSQLWAALGGVRPRTRSAPVRQDLARALSELYTTAPDGGAHSAAGWALRQWGLRPPPLAEATRAPAGRGWFVNRSGMTLVEV